MNGHVLVKVRPDSGSFIIRIICNIVKVLRSQRYEIKLSLQIDKPLNFDLRLKQSDKEALGYLKSDGGSHVELDFLADHAHLFSEI